MTDPRQLVSDPSIPALLRADLAAVREAPEPYDVPRGLSRFEAHLEAASAASAATGAKRFFSRARAPFFGGAAAIVAGVAVAAVAVRPVGGPSAPLPAAAHPDTRPIPSGLPPRNEAPEPPAASADATAIPSPPRPSGGAPARSAGEGRRPPANVAEELLQLQDVRAASMQHPSEAVRLANEGHRRFPHGMLRQERESIAIDALARMGRADEAQTRARAFAKQYPTSPFAERARAIADESGNR